MDYYQFRPQSLHRTGISSTYPPLPTSEPLVCAWDISSRQVPGSGSPRQQATGAHHVLGIAPYLTNLGWHQREVHTAWLDLHRPGPEQLLGSTSAAKKPLHSGQPTVIESTLGAS